MRHLIALLCTLFIVQTAAAQEDDKSFLTRTLQDALSGGGRVVSIDGFSGALSSAASFDRMTISDNDGIWLVLQDVELVWNRSALLRGRLEVDALTAARLDLPRLPKSEEDSAPAAEASGFALPELPVSVKITTFEIAEINLGVPILGEEAQLKVTASATLNDTGAKVDFVSSRTDGQSGEFAIKADFARADQMLNLLLKLSEAEGGIAARLLNLPGQPSVAMKVEGAGPLDKFAADIELATDGRDRVSGKVTLAGAGGDDLRLLADIQGDVTALVATQYREFFGEDIALKLDALRKSDGALDVRSFAIDTAAADLEGVVRINAEGWPSFIDVNGRIAAKDGKPVRLPVGGTGTFVDDVTLDITYDAANGEAFKGLFALDRLALQGVGVDHVDVALDGTLQGNLGSVGQFLGGLTFDANGIMLDDPAAARALGSAVRGKATVNYIEEAPLRIEGLELAGTDYGLTGRVVLNPFASGFLTRLQLALSAQDLGRFSALAGRDLAGAAELTLKGTVTPLAGEFDLDIGGTADDLGVDIAQADALMTGRTALSMKALRDPTGTYLQDLDIANQALTLRGKAELRSGVSRITADARLTDISRVLPQYDGPVAIMGTAQQSGEDWRVDADLLGPYGVQARVDGLATGPDAAISFDVKVPEVRKFAAEVSGPATANGILRATPQGWRVNTDATGPFGTRGTVQGIVAGAPLDIDFDVSLPDLRPVVPQLSGPGRAIGSLTQTNEGLRTETRVIGPYGTRAMVAGIIAGADLNVDYTLSVPNVRPLVPGITGPFDAQGSARQTPQGIAITSVANGPYASSARVEGVATGPNAALDFRVSMPNLGALVPKVSGPLAVQGSARKTAQGWQVDTDADGPAGTQARIAGLVANNGRLELDINGSGPLGLSGPFISPRILTGQAQFDLSLNGSASLSSLSGTVRTSGASLSAPNLRVALTDIAADLQLSNGRAAIDLTAKPSNGGDVRMNGSVALSGGFAADIALGLQNVVVIDPRLYRTTIDGALQVTGSLRGGASISGTVNMGETRVSVPATGLTSIGEIPAIRHIGDTRPVSRTRAKAGVSNSTTGRQARAETSGPGFGLNVRVNAPNRIFVRGRGLDAELGGALSVTGNTNRMISAGRFDLLRGRLDILGKRFDLREGSIQFLGDLVPYIRFVSATDTATGEVRVIVEGPADQPEVTFESTPEAPQDEVLAQLLFGRNLSQLSAFQALQLANAVAVLAGRGGEGIVSNLRDGFGLDDLDVTTTEDGAVALRAGKYISDNVYSDVTAASDGTADVSLNIDLSPNLTLRGSLGSDGNTGIGIYFEKDY